MITSAVLGDLLKLVGVYRGTKPYPEVPQATAAVVLGAQVLPGGWASRTLRVRALLAAQLYSKRVVRVVIPSGGVGKHPPNEATAISEILRHAGVPDEDILPEERGRSTLDSARRVAELARSASIEDVLIVTDPLHCVRAVSMFKDAGLSAAAAPVYDSPMWHSLGLRRGQFLREIGAILWYGLRSLSRGSPIVSS
jgi:vancomycin permeability regulator SanA